VAVLSSPEIREMVEQAYAQLKEGHFEDAIQAFSKCLLLEPSEARAYSGRGTAHLQLRKWQPAAFDLPAEQF